MSCQWIVVIVSIIALAGCTSLRPVEVKTSEISRHLEAGDHLLIHEKSGRTLDLNLTGIEGDLLYGTLADDAGTRVQIAMNDIETIDVEKIDGVKTTLAAVGGTYLSLFALFLVLLATGGVAFMP